MQPRQKQKQPQGKSMSRWHCRTAREMYQFSSKKLTTQFGTKKSVHRMQLKYLNINKYTQDIKTCNPQPFKLLPRYTTQ